MARDYAQEVALLLIAIVLFTHLGAYLNRTDEVLDRFRLLDAANADYCGTCDEFCCRDCFAVIDEDTGACDCSVPADVAL